MFIDILKATCSLGILALIFGIALAIAGKFFHVEEDERIGKISEVLPQANCGGCGFTGCSAYSNAIVNDNVACNLCPVGGDVVSEKIANIMGVTPEKTTRFRSVVMCQGGEGIADNKFNYVGLDDCYTASKLGGGKKTCPYGCLGLGNCVKACKFGAISIENGVAVVDYDKCTACGMCKIACPKNIIETIPYDSQYYIACCNKEKGILTRKYCKKGCIACGMCVKNCEQNAITVTNFNASIDLDKCIKCGKCAKVCPMKCIVFEEKSPIVINELKEVPEISTVSKPKDFKKVEDKNGDSSTTKESSKTISKTTTISENIEPKKAKTPAKNVKEPAARTSKSPANQKAIKPKAKATSKTQKSTKVNDVQKTKTVRKEAKDVNTVKKSTSAKNNSPDKNVTKPTPKTNKTPKDVNSEPKTSKNNSKTTQKK